MIIESYTEEETFKIAKNIAENAKKGEIFCLIGELGVGKTVFSKGFAVGIGVKDDVTSPTFTIIQEYAGKIPLYHFDMYRIENEEELDFIGCDEYFFGEGVCLVEWANNVADAIPDFAKWIYIEKDVLRGFDYRKITIK